jgi:hypothetical protein
MLGLTGGRVAAEIVFDKSPAFDCEEFERLRSFMEPIGVKFTLAKKRAKGGVESHFRALFELLPQHVGSLGGNVSSTKKHRPRHEILVLLQQNEYLEDEEEWDKILFDINKRYNATPLAGEKLGKLETFLRGKTPHAMHLDEQYLAYVSWHHTSRQFLQSEFLIQFNKIDYYFGWSRKDINDSPEKQKFISVRTTDKFDLYMHPESPSKHPLYIFELGQPRLVEKFPLSKMLYGNAIDHKINPATKTELWDAIRQKKIQVQRIQSQLRTASKELKSVLGVDLFTIVKEIQKNGETSTTDGGDVMEQIMKLIGNREVTKIDPFVSAPSSPNRSKHRQPKNLFKPSKVKHQNS